MARSFRGPQVLGLISHVHTVPLFNLVPHHHLVLRSGFRKTFVTTSVRRSSTASPTTVDSKVNAPTSTLPAPLLLPSYNPDESRISFLFQTGRAYSKFYITGFKNVYHNFHAGRALVKTIRKTDHTDGEDPAAAAAAAAAHDLTRSQYQLIRRSRYDALRCISFGMVFVVCGEFTPLVVPFVSSNIAPFTCRIPNQVAGDREALEERRRRGFRELTAAPPAEPVRLEHLDRDQLLHVSRSLDLHSKLWPDGLRLPPVGSLRRWIKRHVEYVKTDDMLIGRDGGVDEMQLEELRIALVERGVDVVGRSEGQLKSTLRHWLAASSKTSTLKLLLTRPSVWQPQRSKPQIATLVS
ncbi:MAG: hypothetical protein M1833_004710 [Piccolia ochrophora]|nr:MAG: hypothetical protein M1833_004710 [Piccolia ochrophora]